MKAFNHFLSLSFLCTTFACSENAGPTVKKQPNILFIAIDDLRPELGCYGNSYIQSPNIDRLAETGAVFTSHFVSVPTCGASRYNYKCCPEVSGNC